MPDSKITALTALTSADPANDMFPIVDVSDTTMAASGTTKRISINNLLAASGTATLASATITGDLTVDTSTLKVDSTNNRVGIVNASPTEALDVTGNVKVSGNVTLTSGSGSLNSQFWYGIGASSMLSSGSASWPLLFGINGVEKMRLDNSGNVGAGVTPSAWSSIYKGFQLGGSGGNGITLAGNDASIGTGYYLSAAGIYNRDNASATASSINMFNRSFIFRTAASGASGSAITWTDSMTLDASGNLLVGKTVLSGTTLGVQLGVNGAVASGMAEQTNAALNLLVYSTGAAASRFYVGMGGTVFATNTTISAISDARLKENVQDLDVGLDAILALKPRKFDWKTGKGKDIKGDRGFIAQEFETVFPNLVDEWKDNAPEGEAPYKSVRQDLIPVLVKAIQELTARVQTLEAK